MRQRWIPKADLLHLTRQMALDSMQVQYAAYCVPVQSVKLVDFLPLPIHQSSNRTPTAQLRYVLDMRVQIGEAGETTPQDTAISNTTHQLVVCKPLLPPESKTSRIHLLKSSFAGQSVNQLRQNLSVSTLSTKSKNPSKLLRVTTTSLNARHTTRSACLTIRALVMTS